MRTLARIFLSFLFLFVGATLAGDVQAAPKPSPSPEPRRYIVWSRGLYGFIDASGKMVIPASYADTDLDFESGPFAEGLAPVKLGDRYGYIDVWGKTVLPFAFEDARMFGEGLARVQQKGKWGCLDRHGRLVVPARYDEVREFRSGLAAVRVQDRWGFVDRKGRVVVPLCHGFVTDFSADGVALVARPKGWWGCVDRQGRAWSAPRFDWAYPFREGLAPAREGSRWGFVGTNGRWKIPPRYRNALPNFHSGRRSPPAGDYVGFFEGRAWMQQPSGGWVLFDRGGRQLAGPFEEVYPFSGGLAAVRVKKQWGYVDTHGRKVIAPRFEEATPFVRGVAAVKMQGRFGLIDRTGKILIQPEYDGLVPLPGSVLLAVKDGRFAYKTLDGQEIWSTTETLPPRP